MPVPSAPSRAYSFTDFSISNPSGQQPGNRLDAEYDRSNAAISDLITFVRGIIADDGTLKPSTVGEAQLKSGILANLGQDAANAAAGSATSAASSATAAGQFAANAQTSAAAAATTAQSVAGQVQNATNSAAAALLSRNEALSFRNAASASATDALNYSNAAAGSAAAAFNSQTLAQRWASDLTGPVGGGLYSAYYYALAAGWRPGGTGVAGTAQGTTFIPYAGMTGTNVQFAMQQMWDAKAAASNLNASIITAGTFDPARIPGIDASKIISGTIDPARIPGIPTTTQLVASGDSIAGLTAGEQTQISQGTIVILTGGRRFMYTGTGSKTSETSYILISDLIPDWSEIANKPATYAPSAHTHDASAIVSGIIDPARLPVTMPTQWNFTATGATVYDVPGANVPSDLAYYVTIDGVTQVPSTHYTVSAVTQKITFDEAVPSGAAIHVRQVAGYSLMGSAVSYAPQTLTAAEMRQALANLGASAVIYGDQVPTLTNGADQTANLQALVNAAAGKMLILPAGTIVTGKITLPTSIKIIGLNTRIKLKSGGNDDIFYGSANNGVLIEGVIFDGNEANQVQASTPNLAGNGVHLVKATNVIFRQCQFVDCIGNGPRLVGCKYAWLEDCQSIDHYANGYYVIGHADGTESNYIWFTRCLAKNCGFSDAINQKFEGFSCDPGTGHVWWTDCISEANDGFGFNAFAGTLGTTTGSIYDLNYINCVSRNNQFGALGLSGVQGVRGTITSYNDCKDALNGSFDADRVHVLSMVHETIANQSATTDVDLVLRAYEAKGSYVYIKGLPGQKAARIKLDVSGYGVGAGYSPIQIDYTESVLITRAEIFGMSSAPYVVDCKSTNANGVIVRCPFPEAATTDYIRPTTDTLWHYTDTALERFSNGVVVNERQADVGEVRVRVKPTKVGTFRFANDTNTSAAYWQYNDNNGAQTWGRNASPLLNLDATGVLYPQGNATQNLGGNANRWATLFGTNIQLAPSATFNPTNNGDLTIDVPSNTQIRFKFKGTDGVIRSGTVTLS